MFNMECMEYMRTVPDKYFDLAIVDPPYGISVNVSMGRRKGNAKSNYKKFAGEDKSIPDEDYFLELGRVSKNQIVWGGELHDRFSATFTVLAYVGQRIFSRCYFCTV